MDIHINGSALEIKNPDKIYFPDQGILKAEVIEYYIKIAPYILPHLIGRPFSMIFFPSGKRDDSFFQKQRPIDAPNFVASVRIPSERRGHINWCTVDNLETLVYFANKSVIEMHTWFSRRDSLDKPDIAVLDIDPSGNTGLKEAAAVANAFRAILDELKIYSVPKTSGSRGIHIFIPIVAQYTYEEIRKLLFFMCKVVLESYPSLCTDERTVIKRGDRIYLDAVQFGRGKTLALPYSLRCRPGAPVSTPLKWEEVNSSLDASDYNIRTIFERLDKIGDLMSDFYKRAQKLPKI